MIILKTGAPAKTYYSSIAGADYYLVARKTDFLLLYSAFWTTLGSLHTHAARPQEEARLISAEELARLSLASARPSRRIATS